MSLEENKAIIRRHYEAANKHKVDLAAEWVAPDFVDYINEIEGLESLKQFGKRLIKGFPDIHARARNTWTMSRRLMNTTSEYMRVLSVGDSKTSAPRWRRIFLPH